MTRGWRLDYSLAGAQFLIAGFHFAAIAPISPNLELEWGLQPIEMGLLASVLFYAYGAMQIPAGLLADLLGSRRMLTLSGLLVAVGAGLFGVATDFVVALIGRLLLGIGTGMVFTGGVRHIASVTVGRPKAGERFTLFLGPFAGLNYLGMALGSWPLTFVVGVVGWRAPLLAMASVSAVLSGMTWALSGVSKPYGKVGRGHILAALAVWRRESTIWVYTVMRFLYGSFVGMQTLWVVPFLSVSLGFGRWFIGLVLLAMALGQAIGPMLGSWLTKRSGRPLAVLKLAAGTYAFGCITLLVLTRVRPEPVFMIITLFVLAVAQTTTLVGYGLVSACVGSELQATVIGMVNVGPWLGTGVFQLLVGYMVQGLSQQPGVGVATSAYTTMLLPLAVVAVMALPLNWLLADKTQS